MKRLARDFLERLLLQFEIVYYRRTRFNVLPKKRRDFVESIKIRTYRFNF